MSETAHSRQSNLLVKFINNACTIGDVRYFRPYITISINHYSALARVGVCANEVVGSMGYLVG